MQQLKFHLYTNEVYYLLYFTGKLYFDSSTHDCTFKRCVTNVHALLFIKASICTVM